MKSKDTTTSPLSGAPYLPHRDLEPKARCKVGLDNIQPSIDQDGFSASSREQLLEV